MFEPENEAGVIVVFAQQCKEAGFEILSIQTAFPDALIRRGDVEYRVEFEYLSSNFYLHGHDPRKADLVICWQQDGNCILPILALSEQGWQQKEVVLPSQDERRIDYWKRRALRAERRIRRIQKGEQQEEEKGEPVEATPTEERAAMILADQPDISGSELGRQLGKSERMGRNLKARLAPVVSDNGGNMRQKEEAK